MHDCRFLLFFLCLIGHASVISAEAKDIGLCADFDLFNPTNHLGHAFELGGMTFTALESGVDFEIRSEGGRNAIGIPSGGLRIAFPALTSSAQVTVVGHNEGSPIVISNLDENWGSTGDSETYHTQGSYLELLLIGVKAKRFSGVQITGGANEGNLARICVKLSVD
jgi:hypothetical protein